MTWLESFGMLIGRLFIASYFLLAGTSKLSSFKESLLLYEKHSIPYPALFLNLSAALLIMGAIGVLVGYRTRISALFLILALLPTTFIFHNFWSQEGDALIFSAVFFFKDIAITGGLLYVLSRGAGLCSIDAIRKRRIAKAGLEG
ncbi:DoxX family protein [Estrella lausannensis]|uniref:Putative membrane protein n=1 Tax=Estrella lausannensis TaxID=483423 RepID=A0A0H5DPE1_9BACT|nr:DoxX family protein [Estrella lausannensis]CRX37838.1 putative membrane protein [Estrella lausannensis]